MAQSDGNVIRTRSIVRLSEDRRWSKDAIQAIAGTPMHPNPFDDSHDIENMFNAHESKDAELGKQSQQETDDVDKKAGA